MANDRFDRFELYRIASQPIFAWPTFIQSLNYHDFEEKPWGMTSQGILSNLINDEFKKCFMAGATMYQVQNSLWLWTEVYAKLFSYLSDRSVDDRYNVTWALFGYTDGMDPKIIELLDSVCGN